MGMYLWYHVQKCEKALYETWPWRVGTFWGRLNLYSTSRPILVGRHVVGGLTICFTMHGMWLGLCII
jgi:hypothetical protein